MVTRLLSQLGHISSLLLLLSLSACAVRSTTTIIRAPAPVFDRQTEQLLLQALTPSCLDMDRLRMILSDPNEESLSALRTKYRTPHAIDELMAKIASIIDTGPVEERAACPKGSDGRRVLAKWQLDSLLTQLKLEHQGLLFALNGNETAEQAKKRALDSLRAFLGSGHRISVTLDPVGSVALSTRIIASAQEPGGVFSNLKERAQAAIIEYAAKFASPVPEASPVDEAAALLEGLSPRSEPTLADTQSVELTVSTALNSASADDRFEYIVAYLRLARMPGFINGRVSLERELLGRFQRFTLGRSDDERRDFETADLQRSYDDLQVRIESVDNLKTEPAKIELGKLTSSADFDVKAGATQAKNIKLLEAEAKVSTSREDTLSRELDKRSAWINGRRSMLRITQRGLQEATISGSLSNAITLKIPKTDLFVLDVVREKGEPTKVALRNIEQPLYAVVDAVGIVLATTRIAIPSSYAFRKEPDGIAYTIVGEPERLRLWSHRRRLTSISVDDLNPQLRGSESGQRRLGMYASVPAGRQLALFSSRDAAISFLADLRAGSLRLKKAGTGWYAIIVCAASHSSTDVQSSASADQHDRPDFREVWLGYEDSKGVSQPFAHDELAPLSGECAKRSPTSKP